MSETCRHCGEEIAPCPHAVRFCKGWRHSAYIASQPVISHYCGGRSAGPLAEPGEQIAVCRADLADLLARLPHEGGSGPDAEKMARAAGAATWAAWLGLLSVIGVMTHARWTEYVTVYAGTGVLAVMLRWLVQYRGEHRA